MLDSFLKALGQLGDGRFQRVLWLGIGLTLGLFIAAFVALRWTIRWIVPDTVTLPRLGEVHWIERVLEFGAIPVMLLASVFLMVPVASAFCGLFLDDVAEAVEDRHYPGLPPAPRIPISSQIWDAIRFFGTVVVVNLVALLVYPFSGPFAPIVFWIVNGFLLGREYFTLAAMRRIGPEGARALRSRYSGTIWLAGALMAAPLSIPVVNLLVPVLGAATFTHLFHRLQAQVPSRP
ncbi:EI24 domain-containing protein [Allitabrizicola rongguiensis]|uniref:EI24 domain-containing protein n=1 Tax=Alitabrizicola rongguiensis TaxID=2909234 RepID=UPI0038731070